MPHIVMKCYPGRTEEQKNLCTQKMAESIAQTMGCPVSSVSIAIEEIAQENWKETVWDAEISPNMDRLYIKPGYTCE